MRGKKRAKSPEGQIPQRHSPSTVPTWTHCKSALQPSLASLIQPLDSSEFLRTVYRKHPAVFHAPPGTCLTSSRLSTLVAALDNLQPREMLENTASDAIHVWMRDKDSGELGSFSTSDVDAALLCYKSGGALYFRANEAFERDYIGKIGKDMGFAFANLYPDGGLRGEVETFVSPSQHHTPWHFDFMENFTVQLKGSKTWRLAPSTIPHPHRSCATHFTKTSDHRRVLHDQVKLHKLHDVTFDGTVDMSQVISVTLCPGDVLYHPAGIWHEVSVASECASVSINLSFFPMSWGDLLIERVQQAVWANAEMRERICLDGTESLTKLAQRKLVCFQRDVVGGLCADDVLPSQGFALPRKVFLDVAGKIYSEESLTFSVKVISIAKAALLKRNPHSIIVAVDPRIKYDIANNNGSEGEEGDEEDDLEEEGLRQFTVHTHFARERMVSEVEVHLFTPPEGAACMFLERVALLGPMTPVGASLLEGVDPGLVRILAECHYLRP